MSPGAASADSMDAGCVVDNGWPSVGSFALELEFIGFSAYCGDGEGRGECFGVERVGSNNDIAENPVPASTVSP